MSRLQANGLLLLAALLWGSGNVMQKTILLHLDPLTTNGLRCLIGATALFPFCIAGAGQQRRMTAGGLWLGLGCVLSFSIATALLQIAYGLTTVSNAGFLANSSTILTPVFAWIVLRERPKMVVVPAAVMAFTGVCLMGGGLPHSLSWGDNLCLIAAACFAIWMVMLGRFVCTFGRSAHITVAQFLGSGILCGALALVVEPIPTSFSVSTGLQLLYLSLASTAGAYLLLAIGQQHTSASEAAIIISMEAVFGAIAAHFLLGEEWTVRGAAGATLILLGIGLVEINWDAIFVERSLPPRQLAKRRDPHHIHHMRRVSQAGMRGHQTRRGFHEAS